MKLRILSWNIWFGTYFEKVKDYLKKSQVDIIGLQEVTQTPDGKNNIGEKLAKELGYEYVYAMGMKLRKETPPMVMGNAVLSKYPIVSHTIHNLSKTENRVAVQANIQIKDFILHIFSTHLFHAHLQSSEIQEEQAKTLVEIMPKERALVMGDFNAVPGSEAIQIMRKHFVHAGGEAFEPTWSVYPEGCEVCKPKLDICFDYFFLTKDIQQTSFQVMKSAASDHLPILLEVEFGT